MAQTAVCAAFVLEQHLGHRTYSENLLEAAERSGDIAFEAALVDYEKRGLLRRFPTTIAGAIVGRRQVRRALRGSAAEVIVYNTQVPAALGGRLARVRPYVAVTDVTPRQYDEVAEGYGHRPDRFPPLRALKDRVNTRVFREAARCVGWSSWVRDSLVNDYGVAPERTAVVPPGVDLGRWRPGPDRSDAVPRILFVGGDFGRKGGSDLLEVFRRLDREAELVLVTKAVVDTGGDRRIRVVSDLVPNDPRLVELYRTSDVFVLPTRAETFGIAAVEAAAAGLPSVTSDVGGLPDIVDDGTTGYTLRSGDTAELGRAVRTLLDDGDLRRAMGRAARERAEVLFDADANARRLLDIVRRAAVDEPAHEAS